jgi:hypothetical protein
VAVTTAGAPGAWSASMALISAYAIAWLNVHSLVRVLNWMDRVCVDGAAGAMETAGLLQ